MSAATSPRSVRAGPSLRSGGGRRRRLLAGIARSSNGYLLWIIAAAAIGIPAMLGYWGFRATAEWQRSSRLLVEQRTSEVVTLMIMALNRDMRAVQVEVLPQLESLNVRPAIYDLSDEVTTAFARFPYPESFFTWTARGSGAGELFAFTRSGRPPHWRRGSADNRAFPTAILSNPPELRPVVDLLRNTSLSGSHVLALETRLDGEPYQVVARARYGAQFGSGPESLAGFLVNLTWAREHYFAELLKQLSNVLQADSAMSMAIFDESGALVAATPAAAQLQPELPVRQQRFPVLFFDPLLGTTLDTNLLTARYWTARAQPLAAESTMIAAHGATRSFLFIAAMALAASVALIFAIISIRSAAALAIMKSEFVSAVTHELKTPLSSIRLASETLVRGRYRSQSVIVQYAELLLNEVSRLTRTIDNLLSITRVHEVGGFYLFEPLDLLALVEEALSRFDLQLREQGIQVHLDLPASLPQVHADRTALLQVLDNLLDNSIRYAAEGRFLGISASASRNRVNLRITDKGPGIPSDELPRVFDKFFRGRKTSAVGSGLGLAIAERVLRDHNGAIRIHSTEGFGTTAEISLPAAGQEEKE